MPAAPQQPNLVAESPGAAKARTAFGALVIVIGIGAGLAAAAFMGLLHAVQHLAWAYHTGDFLNAVTRASPFRVSTVLLGAGLLVVIGGFGFRPSAGGHGGEIYEAIWSKRGRISLFSTLAKSTFSIVIVALGAALGREGAPKQAGAALASFLARRFRLNDEQCRVLVACGAGAGMGAIYNVPLAGALFSLEVLLGGIAVRYVLPAFGASSVATAVTWLFLPNRPTYSVGHYAVTWASLPGALIVGVLAGFLSSFYIKLVGFADARKNSELFRRISPLLVFATLAVAALFYPAILGNGKDIVQVAVDNKLSLGPALLLLVLRTLATTACLNANVPGGLFTPTITLGALVGVITGHGWKLLFAGEDVSTYTLFGAAAFWAASSKGPVSGLVIIMELTGKLEGLLVPLLITVGSAVLVSRWLDSRSIYTVRIHS